MANLNNVKLIGNLTRDPEVRYTPKGSAVADFSLAINRVWKDDSGNKNEETTYVDCVAWAKKAELIGQYVHKGDPPIRRWPPPARHMGRQSHRPEAQQTPRRRG